LRDEVEILQFQAPESYKNVTDVVNACKSNLLQTSHINAII